MKASSLNELKSELETRASKELIACCLRLSKFKKENKELLTYILFEEKFPEAFLENFKKEIDQQFQEINMSNIYYTRKSVRKILRNVNKHVRFTNSAQLETELMIHFCNNMITFDLPVHKSTQLMNMYAGQLKKIDKIISSLHPDLQYDLNRQLKRI